MADPVTIIISGGVLQNWTNMTLSRSKDEMTGTLNVTLFTSAGYPAQPVLRQVAKARPVLVYIAGQLAFTGTVDSRTGNADATSYTVTISARGKTKTLIESSHDHKTGSIKKTDTRKAITELVKSHNIALDWKAEEQELEKVVFRDGGIVVDELHRLASENAHFLYETRDGKLRVTDDTARTTGEALILGDNILSFSAEQSETQDKAEVTVKGKLVPKNARGKAAIEKRKKTVKNKAVKSKHNLTLHHFGNSTDKALKRRATFEANKRSSASANVKLDVFHIQTQSGDAWDIGTVHFVSIPPEGISQTMELTALEYTADNSSTLKTSLTFSPLPSAGGSTPSGGLVGAVTSLVEVVGDGDYPGSWGGPILVDVADDAVSVITEIVGLVKVLAEDTPDLVLKGFANATTIS